MAALKISSAKQQRTYRGLATALASAVLEWLLISLLFANAIFSYLITKFARYCKLQTPCLLCSRLDHVFGNEKLGYYRDLICCNHKLEISSLVLCHAHDKLVDVHGMCENCLFSFATVNKSNSETYRLLVGKLGEDSHSGFDQDPLLEGHKIGCSSTKHCSCCNESWVLGGYTHRLNQTKSIGSEAAELDVPLSGVVGLNQDDLKMRREEPSVSAPHMRNYVLDPLSRVGYTELNVTSDTESEVLYSDDDDKKALLHETDDSKDDLTAQGAHLEPPHRKMALLMSVQFPVTSPFPPPTKAGHPRASVLLKPPRVGHLSLSRPKLRPVNLISLSLRLKAIEETRETPESETQQTESESESQPGGEVGSEIKEAMRKRKEQQQGEGGLWSGVAEEIGEIEWPPFGKVLGTTGVVLSVIAGSSVVLLTVNAVLAELSDRVFAGRGVQDFFG